MEFKVAVVEKKQLRFVGQFRTSFHQLTFLGSSAIYHFG
jgi:hypothetical protein